MIIGIFAIPAVIFVLSTVLYYLVTSGVIKMGTVNNGKLVSPPLKFTDLPLETLDGAKYNYDQPQPKWTLLVIGDGACNGDCGHMLYVARQSIIALGKKVDRVRLAYLAPETGIDAEFQRRIDREYRGLQLMTVEKSILEEHFAKASLQPYQPRTVFVVDPRGWLMMTYQIPDTRQTTLNTLGKAMVQDMKRLIN